MLDTTRIISIDPEKRKPCEACSGTGWLFASTSFKIERCDACEQYTNDAYGALAFAEDVYIESKGEVTVRISAQLQRGEASSWWFFANPKYVSGFVLAVAKLFPDYNPLSDEFR